ncbi:peptidoglycan bridge formation glycyltransferase FemA/FemB family protein, partial [Mammaliicoccus sciuri]
NKAHNYGVKVRFLERDELDIFFKLYRETEERAGFISKTDEYFLNFIDTYGSKALVPLAYIDLNEYIQSTQENLNELETKRDQMMAKENKSEKQLKKIAETDRLIDHAQKELLETSELIKTDGEILNLASG